MLFTIRAFVTFFTIIDHVGLAPVVIGLTTHLEEAQRRRVVTVSENDSKYTIISIQTASRLGLVG